MASGMNKIPTCRKTPSLLYEAYKRIGFCTAFSKILGVSYPPPLLFPTLTFLVPRWITSLHFAAELSIVLYFVWGLREVELSSSSTTSRCGQLRAVNAGSRLQGPCEPQLVVSLFSAQIFISQIIMAQDGHFTFSHSLGISNIRKEEIKNTAQRSCGIRHSSHVCGSPCEPFIYRLLGRIYTHSPYYLLSPNSEGTVFVSVVLVTT